MYKKRKYFAPWSMEYSSLFSQEYKIMVMTVLNVKETLDHLFI